MSDRSISSLFSGYDTTETTLFIPPEIKTVADTGLNLFWLQDHTLKVMYYQGNLTGNEIASEIALPFVGVTEVILESLKREKYIEVKTSVSAFGEGSYQYTITNLGIDRAKNELNRNTYAGPAPVTLETYNKAILQQSKHDSTITREKLAGLLKGLVLNKETIEKLGPAFNSGTSTFLYGPTGNGKTSVAQAFGSQVNAGTMYVPHSIIVDGQIIKLYDSVNHRRVKDDIYDPNDPMSFLKTSRPDARWVEIYRPFVVVGGELTLEGLDLVFNEDTKFYEAPFQVKANGGCLLIDDFGRQLVRPRDLLNRWIVPLENRIDFLTLHTGKKIEIPFDVMVIFSTNLPPKELVDEAFLRRLRHKIEIKDPTLEEYQDIFRIIADSRKIRFSPDALEYLIAEWYTKFGRNLRASHPRDLCDQIIDIARFRNIEPVMSKELLEAAASSYFVEL